MKTFAMGVLLLRLLVSIEATSEPLLMLINFLSQRMEREKERGKS